MNTSYLIINVGSTSIKSHLFAADLHSVASLNAEYSAESGLIIDGVDRQGQLVKQQTPESHDAKATLAVLLRLWQQWLSRDDIKVLAIGHRIVHGGEYFARITCLNPQVLAQIEQLDSYAPLHNPLNRLGVAMAEQDFPDTPQFAVFDTAFHRHIPEYAGRYAIPENLSTQIRFYRYGFHGISCQHSVAAAAQILAVAPENLNLIILHLGGGASVTAVQAGISVDTSMGFSPTDGLLMASRCGDIDPMIGITLQRQGLSVAQLDNLLNKQSGLQGICADTDMRRIMHRAEQGDAKAALAVEMFCYRIKKYIGAYCAVLGDISGLIFTGGIGEHAPLIRQKILHGLEHLGITLDTSINQLHCDQYLDISAGRSQARVLVIHAQEEREIARQIHGFFEIKTHS